MITGWRITARYLHVAPHQILLHLLLAEIQIYVIYKHVVFVTYFVLWIFFFLIFC